MKLNYSQKVFIHAYNHETKKITLCGLGAMSVGVMDVDYSDEYLEYPICTGCAAHTFTPLQFKQTGILRDLVNTCHFCKHNSYCSKVIATQVYDRITHNESKKRWQGVMKEITYCSEFNKGIQQKEGD